MRILFSILIIVSFLGVGWFSGTMAGGIDKDHNTDLYKGILVIKLLDRYFMINYNNSIVDNYYEYDLISTKTGFSWSGVHTMGPK